MRAWSDRFQSGRAVVLAWMVTRLLMLALLAAAERFMVGDVFYYHRKIAALTSVGLGKTLNEYPTRSCGSCHCPTGLPVAPGPAT